MEKDVAIGVPAGKEIDPMDVTYWDDYKVANYILWMLDKRTTNSTGIVIELVCDALLKKETKII